MMSTSHEQDLQPRPARLSHARSLSIIVVGTVVIMECSIQHASHDQRSDELFISQVLNVGYGTKSSKGKLVINDFMHDLTIEVMQGRVPRFVFKLPSGQAPAGLLQILVLEESTGDEVWSIDYGSDNQELGGVKAYVEELEPPLSVDSLPPQIVERITAFRDWLEEEIPPLSELEYGAVPDGWSQNRPAGGSKAPKLLPGKTYIVFATGAATGNARFSLAER